MRAEFYSLKAVRRGFVSLVCGRFVSAGLTMAAMILIARGLGVAEFGVYALLLSALSLAITYTSLGLDWVSAKYLPEFRIHAGARDLGRLILALLGGRALSFAVLVLAGYALLGLEADLLGIPEWIDILELYLLVLFMEGLVRSLRGEIFEPLLLQGHSQVNAAVRGALFCGLVLYTMQDGLTLHEVVMVEIVASAVALGLALVQLAAYAVRHLGTHAAAEGWTPPPLREVFAIAGHNYAAQLVSSLASANTLMLIGTSMLNPAAVAGFGFCRTFAEQIRRYLPIALLFTVARPSIVAAYSMDNRFDRLLERVQFLYKANLIVLLPVVILTIAYGDAILELISGGKYGDSWGVAVGFALFLVAQSHRVVLSLVTNILGCPELTTVGSVASTVALPLAFILLAFGFGANGLVVALLVGEVLSHAVIIAALYRRGYPYRFDVGGFARLFAAAGLTLVATLVILPGFGETTLEEIAAAAVPVLLFGVLALLLWPFSVVEREAIVRMIGRRPRASGGV
ncbi:lipopolysaccharide biosynthesis protein [Azospirillum halopraeferens]|uniref:lipopolysaccharide biosynthesis protein n=1 Tax=Azospirillum halopraeferens TaxID=34010 RepID=UPI000428D3A2|nr:oligosaccharide flippase family protein [Azospirillum halopraeferens]